MRIITGTARGTRLKTLEGTDTRPTTEICKEGVFSAIQFDIADRNVLDLFGGSGQMALEALSRGARFAVVADNSRKACAVIKDNAAATKLFKSCRVVCADWQEYIRGNAGKEKFGRVFLDPPYTPDLLDEIIKRLIYSDMLTDDAIIVAESARDGVPEPAAGFRAKLYRYGKTYVSILRRETEEGEETE